MQLFPGEFPASAAKELGTHLDISCCDTKVQGEHLANVYGNANSHLQLLVTEGPSNCRGCEGLWLLSSGGENEAEELTS